MYVYSCTFCHRFFTIPFVCLFVCLRLSLPWPPRTLKLPTVSTKRKKKRFPLTCQDVHAQCVKTLEMVIGSLQARH